MLGVAVVWILVSGLGLAAFVWWQAHRRNK